MLLARHINEDTEEGSKLYRLLRFFVASHLADVDDVLIDNYMQALMQNNIALIVKTILSYKPAERLDVPDYDKVSATLIAA